MPPELEGRLEDAHEREWQASVYCKCDGNGWVYLPVKVAGCLPGVARVRCNCKAGSHA